MALTDPSEPRDLIRRRGSFAVLWGIPVALLALAAAVSQRVPVLADILFPIGYLWIGGACLGNAFYCRRTHCILMGPLFLALGLTFIGNMFGVWFVSLTYIRNATIVVLVAAFLPEMLWKKYLRK